MVIDCSSRLEGVLSHDKQVGSWETPKARIREIVHIHTQVFKSWVFHVHTSLEA